MSTDALSAGSRPASLGETVRTWAEMIKFGHSVFALPFAILATFLAARSLTPPALPSWTQCGLIVLCMVAARSAAMTFNRIIDARYDAANPRTAMRALPRGTISRSAAWGFFAAAAALFIVACGGFWWLSGNAWPLLLSVPTLLLLSFYSLTKRFTRWSHVVLGAAIAFAPVAAWIAVAPGSLGLPAWLLMIAAATWIAGFDIIYACQDVEFDRAAGLHSLPARIGIGPALWLSRGMHVLTVGALCAAGMSAELGVFYFAGVACAAALLLIEQSLVRANDLSRVNLAFFTINGVVGVLMGGLGVADVVWQVLRL